MKIAIIFKTKVNHQIDNMMIWQILNHTPWT